MDASANAEFDSQAGTISLTFDSGLEVAKGSFKLYVTIEGKHGKETLTAGNSVNMGTRISIKNLAYELSKESSPKQKVLDEQKIGFPNKIANLEDTKKF